jgi:hypothetical protein
VAIRLGSAVEAVLLGTGKNPQKTCCNFVPGMSQTDNSVKTEPTVPHIFSFASLDLTRLDINFSDA